MANRNFPNLGKMYNFHVMPVCVDMQIAIGATGAPTIPLAPNGAASSSPGVQSVTRLAAGIYQIQLKDNYASLQIMESKVLDPATGSSLDPNTGTTGAVYEIQSVGNSNFVTAGVPASITPAVGVRYVQIAAPAAGTGLVKLVSPANVTIGLASTIQNSINPSLGGSFAGTNGAIIIIRTLASGTATDPTAGSVLQLALFLNNSSVQ